MLLPVSHRAAAGHKSAARATSPLHEAVTPLHQAARAAHPPQAAGRGPRANGQPRICTLTAWPGDRRGHHTNAARWPIQHGTRANPAGYGGHPIPGASAPNGG
jgi:hypothetical protein